MSTGILRCGTLELEGEISYLTKASKQIGDIYFQLPGKPEPSTLFYGTWENISSEYAGDFFRAEGGRAEVFDPSNLTEQEDAIRDHKHPTSSGYVNTDLSLWGQYTDARSTFGHGDGSNTPQKHLTGSPLYDESGNLNVVNIEEENIPVNRTIRIWERIPEV